MQATTLDVAECARHGVAVDMDLPQAGYLHEFHVVTVRPEGIQVAMLPVGTVLDPKLITGEVSEDAALLHEKLVPENVKGLTVKADGSAEGVPNSLTASDCDAHVQNSAVTRN